MESASSDDDQGPLDPQDVPVVPLILPPATEVATSKVHLDPANHRKVFEVDGLLESIARVGILQPPLLWADVERDCFFVLVGNRRMLCAQKLGLATILARVLPGPLSPREKGRYQLIENLQRVDLRPSEESHAYRELVDGGMTGREIAVMLSIHDVRVSRKLALLRLAQPLLDAVDAGVLTESVGWELSHLKPDAQLELAERLGDLRRVDRKTAKKAVHQLSGKAVKPRAGRLSCKLGEIAITLSATQPLTWDSLIETLDRLRKEARTLRDGGQDVAELARMLRVS